LTRYEKDRLVRSGYTADSKKPNRPSVTRRLTRRAVTCVISRWQSSSTTVAVPIGKPRLPMIASSVVPPVLSGRGSHVPSGNSEYSSRNTNPSRTVAVGGVGG
jgi:hypothetical protein